MDKAFSFTSKATDLLFAYRRWIILLFLAITAALAYQAAQLRPDASFEKMIPVNHPYVLKFFQHRDDLKGLGNVVRVIVASEDGDIFTEKFQQTLRKVHDEVFYISGVDRSGMESLWSPNVRWREVTEDGFMGGTVIPDTYDGSAASLQQLRANTLRSGQVGRLVANDFSAAMIIAPLADIDPQTGEKLDYQALSQTLEEKVRQAYQGDGVRIHITGFAKVVGDLIDGAVQVGMFFGVAFLITLVLLYLYSRCYICTAITLLCSTIAVVWQLGLLHLLGYGLDPYSMLVPFLVFAIGVSHSVQIINGICLNIVQGANRLDASMLTFSRLFSAGIVALLSDGIGFLTLIVIDIPVIQELAIAASIGVAVLILTNLLLIPLLMSYTGISGQCHKHHNNNNQRSKNHWRILSRVASKPWAPISLCLAVALLALGLYAGKGLQIGDLDPGAPELRPDSRYNRDNAFLIDSFSTSTDAMVVMAETPSQACGNHATLDAVDYLQGVMENVPGVQSSLSMGNLSKLVISGMNEGSPKWYALSRNQYVLNNSLSRAPSSLLNTDCSMLPIILFLNDHKAQTIKRVVAEVEEFAAAHNSETVSFHLAAGNAGIEAATNEVIGNAQYEILLWVYAVVSLLCLATFRSAKIVVCIIAPLALTSVLAHGLMAALGIGVKVATMPVIALGVGIGVDYGIYIYTRLKQALLEHASLPEAYFHTLRTTGTAVAFTGVTLALGVGTWAFSPIKFQADMGIMLTFMFLWNMVGALLLLPALAWLFDRPAKNNI